MIDPADIDQLRGVVEQILRERDQTQDRKAKARADADAFLRDLTRRDPRPEQPPVTVTTVELPIQRLDFFSDPAQQGQGGSSGSSGNPIYPGADGVYADKWSDGGATYVKVKLDEISVDDCSSGTTVTRKFLALPP